MPVTLFLLLLLSLFLTLQTFASDCEEAFWRNQTKAYETSHEISDLVAEVYDRFEGVRRVDERVDFEVRYSPRRFLQKRDYLKAHSEVEAQWRPQRAYDYIWFAFDRALTLAQNLGGNLTIESQVRIEQSLAKAQELLDGKIAYYQSEIERSHKETLGLFKVTAPHSSETQYYVLRKAQMETHLARLAEFIERLNRLRAVRE